MIKIPESLQLTDVENRVIATLINNPSYIYEFNLKADSYFTDSANKKIYEAIFQVKDVNPNLDTIKSRLDIAFHPNLVKLAQQSALNRYDFKSDFSLLRENDFLVKVYTANESLNLAIPNLTKDYALDKIQEWRDNLDKLAKHSIIQADSTLLLAKDILPDVLVNLESAASRKGQLLGLPTGIKMLDDYTLGLIKKNLIIVAGRPGAGKTALAGTILRNYILRQEPKPLYFFSLEMPKEEIIQRLMSSIARVKFQKLRTGLLSKDEWLRIIYAKSIIDSSNLYIDDTPAIPVDSVENKIAEAKDLGLVCIDYIQLMTAKAETRSLEIGKITGTCKTMAKRFDVPVVALSQLNRLVEADKNNKRPDISHLRECVTGDTLVSMVNGHLKPIKTIKKDDRVLSIDANTLKVKESIVNDVWSTGEKEVFKVRTQTGNEIRATTNHPFLTVDGWKSTDSLSVGDMIGTLNVKKADSLPADKKTLDLCRFLGYMCGNGTMQKHRSIGCIVSDEDVKNDIINLISSYFPKLTIRIKPNKCKIPVWDMYFTRTFENESYTYRGNELINWLNSLHMIGVKDCTKFVPDFALDAGLEGYKQFISGYLATDGSVSSVEIGIVSVLDKGYIGIQATMPVFNLKVPVFDENIKAFLRQIEVIGKKGHGLQAYKTYVADTNGAQMGVLPKSVSLYASKYPEYRFNNRHIRFSSARRLLDLHDRYLQSLLDGDVFFDRVVAIEKCEEKEETFDISIAENHNFIGNGLIVHNSGAIEQDADMVLLLYRDKYYHPDTQYGDTAEIIIGKQRNGPTGTVYSLFLDEYVSFESLEVRG